jgi:hypothetical protein
LILRDQFINIMSKVYWCNNLSPQQRFFHHCFVCRQKSST